MNTPLVSIIVTLYNQENLIFPCVEHLLDKQVYKNIEILLVDNGSKDNTTKTMRECEKKYPSKVRAIIERPINPKWLPADSRQRGVENVKGEFFTFCDCDDIITEFGLQKLVDKIKDEQVDMVVGSYIDIEEGSEKVLKTITFKTWKRGVAELDIYKDCMIQNRLFRTSWIKENEISFPKEKIFEDTCFTLLCNYFARKVEVTNEIVYKHYITKTSFSNRSKKHKYKFEVTNEKMPIKWFEKVSKEYFTKGKTDRYLFQWKMTQIIMTLVLNPIVIGFGHTNIKEGIRIAKEFRNILLINKNELRDNPYFNNKEVIKIVPRKFYYVTLIYKVSVELKFDWLLAIFSIIAQKIKQY